MRRTVLTVVLVLPLRAGELNCNCVPVVIFPVLVTESATLANYAVNGKTKVQGMYQKFGLVSYSNTRTGNTGVTRAGDESPRDGENLLGKEGDIERLREWAGSGEQVQNRLVARLVSHDRGTERKDGRVFYELSSTQVRRNADVLNRTRDR